MGLITGLIFAALGLFFGAVAMRLGADKETFEIMNTYLKVIFVLCPLFYPQQCGFGIRDAQ